MKRQRQSPPDFIREIDFTQMEYLHSIACGGMSQISLYKWSTPKFSRDVAMKTLLRTSIGIRYKEHLKNEMSILADLSHENIVKTFGTVETDRDYGLVMEYLPLGSYRNYFDGVRSSIGRSETAEKRLCPLKIEIISEIIAGMKYLHGKKPKKVLHLDLKSDNILLNSELHVKICDFGLGAMSTLNSIKATTTSAGGCHPEAVAGTSFYISPTRLLNYKSTPTALSDVYAFGILSWEIVTDRHPFEGTSLETDLTLLALHVGSGNARPDIQLVPNIFPEKLKHMMKHAWSPKSNDRPSFDDLDENMFSLKHCIVQYKGKVQRSRSAVLSRTVGDAHQSTSSISVNPESITIPKIHPSNEEGETVPKSHSENAVEPRVIPENQMDERTPLLSSPPLYSRRKKIMSVTKVLIGIAILISAGTGIAVIVWKATGNNVPCPTIYAPLHGNMSCAKESNKLNMKCGFTCVTGYELDGENVILCSGGKWNDCPPKCERACSALPQISHGKISCTNGYIINSTCTVDCIDNHETKVNTTTCRENATWTYSDPSCVCPNCHIGEGCQYSTSWKAVDYVLEFLIMYMAVDVNYGGHVFTCQGNLYKIGKFHGKCTDKTTGALQDCNNHKHGYGSASGSAKHAAAKLITILSQSGKYPNPCDPQDVPLEC